VALNNFLSGGSKENGAERTVPLVQVAQNDLDQKYFMSRFIYSDVPLQLGKLSNNRLIREDSLGIGEHLSKMTLREHNMLIYADVNSLREIYCSHSRKSPQSRNNAIIILYHYGTKGSIRNTLKEFDIEVKRYEADRSLIIMDANKIIFRPTLDSFM
jgi:hypothetical protein